MFLARIVIPRSRSRSLESRMHSPWSWLARNWPDWRSIDVDQGGLAVVDVGDDRHVADVVASNHEIRVRRRSGGACRKWAYGERGWVRGDSILIVAIGPPAGKADRSSRSVAARADDDDSCSPLMRVPGKSTTRLFTFSSLGIIQEKLLSLLELPRVP